MKSPAEVLSQLARGPAVIRALVTDVPPTDLRRRPRDGKWSAHEHACHLALMEPLWLERVERIVREDRPTIISYEPDADEPPDRLLSMELPAALDAYENGRRTLLARLAPLPPEAWARPAAHSGHAR